MRRSTFFASVLAAAALVPAGAASTASAQTPGSCAGADVATTQATAPQAAAATVCLVNIERAKAGLPALKRNKMLAGAARRYARKMVTGGFFDHSSPDGSTMQTRIQATRYLTGARSWGMAENIAWGQGTLSTPRAIVTGWMNSAGHRANILDGSLKDIGVGIAQGAPAAGGPADAATFVHDFGRRA